MNWKDGGKSILDTEVFLNSQVILEGDIELRDLNAEKGPAK
jgi:hypothetical protein